MSSLNLTDVAAYQDYVQDFREDLLMRAFFGFRTATLVTPHEGLKGKLTLTDMTITDIVRRYSPNWNPQGELKFTPRTLEVVDAKVDLEIVPKAFEGSYLGMMRQKGQNSMDLPFRGYIIQRKLQEVSMRQEIAFWQGEAAGAPAETDTLNMLFDGVLKLVADAITATTLTPVATGALTPTNTVAAVRAVYDALDPSYKDAGADVFLSYSAFNLYAQDYQNQFGKFTGKVYNEDGSIAFDLNPNVRIHRIAGMGDSQRIIITPRTNLHYGFDASGDSSLINFEQQDRTLKMWMDFKMGVQIGILEDGIIAVNDQA